MKKKVVRYGEQSVPHFEAVQMMCDDRSVAEESIGHAHGGAKNVTFSHKRVESISLVNMRHIS